MATGLPVSLVAAHKAGRGSWEGSGLGVRADLSLSPGLACLYKLHRTGASVSSFLFIFLALSLDLAHGGLEPSIPCVHV